MSKIKFDQEGSRLYETGVEQVVLYKKKPVEQDGKEYANGVAWNGVTAVNQNPSGAEVTKMYADNIAYLSLVSKEELGATIEAYSSPEEFDTCDGTAEIAIGVRVGQQNREAFGLSYRTKIGNDEDGDDYGEIIHLLYNAKAKPASKAYSTINETPSAMTLSWELTTTPVKVTGKKPTASVEVDTTKVDSSKLQALEDLLYGIDAPAFSESSTYKVGDYVTNESKVYKCKTPIDTAAAWDVSKWDEVDADKIGPRLPSPDEVAAIFANG